MSKISAKKEEQGRKKKEEKQDGEKERIELLEKGYAKRCWGKWRAQTERLFIQNGLGDIVKTNLHLGRRNDK